LVPWVLDHLKPPPFKIARVETSLAAVETELCWVRFEFPQLLGPGCRLGSRALAVASFACRVSRLHWPRPPQSMAIFPLRGSARPIHHRRLSGRIIRLA
jgi:hypothetical protein